MESFQLGPVPAFAAGADGPPIVLLTGPPFSAALFRGVQSRLGPRRTVALELLGAAAPNGSAKDLLQAALAELRPLSRSSVTGWPYRWHCDAALSGS